MRFGWMYAVEGVFEVQAREIDMYQNTWVSFGSWLQGDPATIWVCVDTACAVWYRAKLRKEEEEFHYRFSISNGDCHIGSDILEPDQHHRFTRPVRGSKPQMDPCSRR